jgi:hypothetical protein
VDAGGGDSANAAGVGLASGEAPVTSQTFIISWPLFFLRWELTLTSRRLTGRRPHTFLGVVPLGFTRIGYPLGTIAGIQADMRVALIPLLLALVLFGLGILLFASYPNSASISLALGMLALVASIRTAIAVTNTAGERLELPVTLLERGKAIAFADAVTDVIATYAHGASADPPPSAQTPARSSEERLLELSRLRDAGLLTAEEYEAKRRDVIAGL